MLFTNPKGTILPGREFRDGPETAVELLIAARDGQKLNVFGALGQERHGFVNLPHPEAARRHENGRRPRRRPSRARIAARSGYALAKTGMIGMPVTATRAAPTPLARNASAISSVATK